MVRDHVLDVRADVPRKERELRLDRPHLLVLARRQRQRFRAVLVAALADELERAVVAGLGGAALPQPFVQRAEAHLVLGDMPLACLHDS